MTERIDDAAQARKIMLEVNTDERGAVALELLDEIEKWVYDATMREAQVHATLALVEQQRIANRIALGMYTNADGSRPAQFAVTRATGMSSVGVHGDIREALNLS